MVRHLTIAWTFSNCWTVPKMFNLIPYKNCLHVPDAHTREKCKLQRVQAFENVWSSKIFTLETVFYENDLKLIKHFLVVSYNIYTRVTFVLCVSGSDTENIAPGSESHPPSKITLAALSYNRHTFLYESEQAVYMARCPCPSPVLCPRQK